MIEEIIYDYHTMPLNIFIERVDNGTIDEGIYNEFLNAIKDKEQSYIQKLIKEINLLEARYVFSQTAIRYYEQINDPEIFSVIIQLVTSAQRTDTLQMIVTRTGKMLTELENKKRELETILPKEAGQKHDRKYFTHLILQASKHLKYQINKKETSVEDFAEIIIDMRATYEALEKEFKKSKNAK